MIPLDPTLVQPLSWKEFGWHPIYYQLEHNSGNGDQLEKNNFFFFIGPALLFAIFFFFARSFCKEYIFNSLGRSCGIKSKVKLGKFGYQLWLGLAYTSSCVYGLWAFNQEPYWGWPMSHANSVVLWDPETTTTFMWFYYWWGAGFYIAELFAIFVEPKRSDFLEYLLHHLVTIGLMSMSCWTGDMRFGCMTLWLHDVTDIFLCVAKIGHYMKSETVTNAGFALFVGSFAFLRFVCLPFLLESAWFQATRVRAFDLTYSVNCTFLLVLQVLHVYWFVLVLKMVIRLFKGGKGDVRSDDE